jgi:PAS domain S-box-containing protein
LSQPSPNSEPLRILVVEDNPGDAYLIRSALEEGHADRVEVRVASGLDEAATALARCAADVVLLDLGLPGSDGLETFLRFRQIDPATPVLVLSGLDDQEVASACVQEGAQDFLIKGEVHSDLLGTIRRAVEREQLRAQLEAARRDFASLVASSVDAILVVAVEDGLILHANPAAETLFGAVEGQLVGRDFDHAGLGSEPLELEIPQIGGARFTVEVRAAAVTWRARSAKVVTFRDVTERKFLTEAREVALAVARRREFESAAYARGARQVIEATSFELCIQELFESCRQLLGAEAGCVVLREGGVIRSLGGEECDPRCRVAPCGGPDGALHARAFESGQVIVDNDVPPPDRPTDGHVPIDNVLIAPMLLDGEVLGLLKVANKEGGFSRQDQRVAGGFAELAAIALSNGRMLEALQTSEARLQQFFDHAPEYCYLVGLDGRITDVNRATLEGLGYRREELVGNPVGSLYAPECQEQRGQVRLRTSQGEGVRNEEILVLAHDGTRRKVLLSSAAIHDSKGRIISFVGIQRDVTELRRIEASLAQSDRLASMGLLAAGVAHEINNPLSYVLLNLEALTEELPDLVGGEEPALLASEAAQGARRIREIVRGLGSFSRVEQTEARPLDLHLSLRSALEMARNEIGHRARLVEDLTEVPAVRASEGRLSQVFLNLLINAAQAIPGGSADENEIRVTTRLEQGQAVIEIQDSGNGIPPEHLPHLFEPFYTTKEVGVGSGLGLAISQGIIADLGGTIEVESTVWVGSTFRVRLPLDEPELGEQAGGPTPEIAPEPHRARILLVDDEAPLARALANALGERHDVEVLESRPPDIEREERVT